MNIHLSAYDSFREADGEGFELASNSQGKRHFPDGSKHNPKHGIQVPNNEAGEVDPRLAALIEAWASFSEATKGKIARLGGLS